MEIGEGGGLVRWGKGQGYASDPEAEAEPPVLSRVRSEKKI